MFVIDGPLLEHIVDWCGKELQIALPVTHGGLQLRHRELSFQTTGRDLVAWCTAAKQWTSRVEEQPKHLVVVIEIQRTMDRLADPSKVLGAQQVLGLLV